MQRTGSGTAAMPDADVKTALGTFENSPAIHRWGRCV
jgi:hypothetical protein